jgi:hypothetical protein
LPHRLAAAKRSALGPNSCSSLEEWEGEDADGTAGRVLRYGLRCLCSLGNHRTTLCKEQRKEMTVVTGTS